MADGKYSETLKLPGFLAFFWTQFLGAFNDNFLKIVVSFIALDLATRGSSSYVELIAFLFILPSALFSGYAGHLADVYSKRNILVAVKFFEIIIMILALAAFFTGHFDSMLALVFLMGLHAAFFSPAKYGILPEMLPDKDLSRGNGLLEMSTFMAIILGTSLGGALFASWKHNLPLIGVVMIAIAILGAISSLGIPRVPASGAAKLFRINPFGEILGGLGRLRNDRTLWLTVFGISYFWFLGALVQINILFFGKELLHLDEWSAGRWARAAFYREEFSRLGLGETIRLPVEVYARSGLANHHIYNQFVICAPRRDELRAHLTRAGIGTEIYYPLPLHLQECFRDLGYQEGEFPESERASKESLALPIFPELLEEQQSYVVEQIAAFYGRG